MAGTVTVDCNGNGDYTSIQEAINNANSGDSIVVMPGIYTENIDVNKSVSIISESENPNDTTILSASSGDDVIHVTADNVTICGFNITRLGASYADELYPDYYYSGIFLDRVENNLIEDNVLSHNYKGIFLDCSFNNILIDNTVFLNGGGISLFCSEENILVNNSAFSGVVGINLFMSSNNSLAFNNISSCSENGISFYESPNTTVTGNNITYCNHGINIETMSENSRVTDNDVTLNNYGITLFYAYYNTICGNTVSDNSQSGFFIRNSLYNTLNDNIVSNNSEYGVHFKYSAHSNLVYNNYFNNTNNAKDECSNVWNTNRTTGTNIVGGPYLGGNFWASPDGTGFSQTQVDVDGDGICDESYSIEGSNVDNLPLFSDCLSYVTVARNGSADFTTIQAAVNAVSEGATIYVCEDIFTENIYINKSITIVSKPGPDHVTIQPLDEDKNLITINADNVILNGFTLRGANYSKALFLYESSGCLIENNIVESNKYGIYLNNSDNNEIINNTLKSNDYIGLCLFESNDNEIKSTYSFNDFIGFDLVKSCNNTVIDNHLQDDKVYGIYFHESSHNNSLVNNSIIHTYYYEVLSSSISVQSMQPSNTAYSDEFELFTKEIVFSSNENDSKNNTHLLLSSASSSYITPNRAVASGNGLFFNHDNTGNLIMGNIIENSYYYGITIYSGSSANLFYNNYFNNTVNLKQYFNASNTWNVDKTAGENIVGGPYIGGNCWTNPDGTDFSQTHLDTDEDGICDESYVLNLNNVDNLPLYSYQNLLPEASIFSISPGYVKTGEMVYFAGIGIDHDGFIQEYSWESSIDGILSDDAYFSTNTLSPGNHTIYFKVKDNEDEWSAEVTSLMIVENDDEAYIRSQVYNGSDLNSIFNENAIHIGSGHYAIEINSSNFKAFNYDLDTNTGSESFRICNSTNSSQSADGRTIEEGIINYKTEILQVNYEADFDNEEAYGSTYPTTYPSIGFFGDRYVSLSDENPDEIVKLLLDSDDTHVIRKSSALELPEGYELTAKQIDVEGDKVWMELSQNGEFIEDEVIDLSGGPATWEYDLDIGDEENVIVFRLLVTDVFAGQVDELVVVEGIWLIDFENTISVEMGSTFNEMEVQLVDNDSIRMNNLNNIILEKDSTMNVANDLNFKVADSEALRFCLIKTYDQSTQHDIPGAIATGPESWNYLNFAGLFYDIDNAISSETLEVTQPLTSTERIIHPGNLTYTITIQKSNFSCDELNSDGEQYEVVGILGEKYIPLEKGNPAKLGKLLLDTNKEYVVTGSGNIDFKDGYGIHYSYDEEEDEFYICFQKGNWIYGGTSIDDTITFDPVSQDAIWKWEYDIAGVDDVRVMKLHIKKIEGPLSNQFIIDGVWILDFDNILDYEISDEYGMLEVTDISNKSITFSNWNYINLLSGERFDIYDSLKLEVADNSTLYYYPVIEKTIPENTPANIDSYDDYEIRNYQNENPTINISLDYPSDVVWYLDGDYKQINYSITDASYNPDAYASGDYDITAFVSNENGTDIIRWDWRIIKPLTSVDITHTGNIEIRSPVYDKNDIVALNNNNTFIEINASNFAGFYCDMDRNLSTETIVIANMAYSGNNDLNIGKYGITYLTSVQQVMYKADFENTRYSLNGTYPIIGILGDPYVPITEIETNTQCKFAKLLVDNGNKYTLRTNSSLELADGYVLTAKQIDVEGNKVWMELSQNGEFVDDEVIDVSSGLAVWESYSDIGNESHVLIYRLLVSDVFQGQVDALAVTEGMWLIDSNEDNLLEIGYGDRFSELDIDLLDNNRITMSNNHDDIILKKGADTTIALDLSIKLSNSSEQNFYLKKDIYSTDEYELRGTVATGPIIWNDELSWNYKDFAGFAYDFEENIGTEQLNINYISNSSIEEEGITYYTTLIQKGYAANFTPENNIQNNETYPMIGIFGEEYVSFTDSRPDELAKLIIDSDSQYTLKIGSPLELPEGYELIVNDIEDYNTAVISIFKNGELLYSEKIDAFAGEFTLECKEDIGSQENIIVLRTNIKEITSGQTDSYIVLNGLWLVDSKSYLAINTGDRFGELVVDSITEDNICMFNFRAISIGKGYEIELAEGVKLRIADSDSLRFYPYREYETTGSMSNYAPSVSSLLLSTNKTTYGSEVSFYGNGTDQDGYIVAYNWRSNIDGQLSTYSTFTSSELSACNHTIYFKVKDNNGDWSNEVSANLVVEAGSGTGSISTTTSSGSGGGGGGGGTTGETYENIAFKDVRSEFVKKDVVTSYDFDDDNNEVEYIQFTASRNWGEISATIECLYDTSTLVDKEPEGTVYRHVNIWVGKSGFSNPENIKDCVIGFKVGKLWLLENGIDESSVRLLHYLGGEWEELDTRLVDEDSEYFHFEAGTNGFSPFAIVGHSKEKSSDDTATPMPTGSVNDLDGAAGENVTEPQPKSTPAFGSMMGILSIFLAGYCMVYRK
ncbi:S-layer protein domain-containing protein [Methanolobus psychrotolerans]|uniref:S-layer protein domain-containing protein n=1 Tax=Methanolobus psychrotolerans TaxID=1874706 RepID=UPI0013EB3CEB|nr:S-layer protein domain-containing protein [Methanolobus psychrotolerans]